ncbi:hypothetical protein [Micromonospora sp. NPDC023737]|uniref:hypothetical protein n=1 Tax=unclassified Micromonospora TaxID=2617518 RepID=UPI00341153E5
MSIQNYISRRPLPNEEEVNVRIQFFRCRRAEKPKLPRRVRGANMPAWMRQQTTVFPTLQPGRAGNLTPAQQYRANGGRW